jgi:hypothetical protein
MHQSNGADRKNTLYNKSKMQSVEEEQSKRASPQVPATVPYRVRTGSNDFPNEMPLPLKINSNDIVIEVEISGVEQWYWYVDFSSSTGAGGRQAGYQQEGTQQ